MIKILIGNKSRQKVFVSSENVAAVVFPCSHFESHTLWKELQVNYSFSENELIQPTMTEPHLVDWVNFLGEQKPIYVNLWCWSIKSVWLVFVEPTGDMFSYNLVNDWLNGHFACQHEGRKSFFDPFNFHNCVHVLRAKIKELAV